MNLIVEVIGWFGAVLVLIAYMMATLGLLGPTSPTSLALNIAGAIGLMINAAVNQALPSATLNLIWLMIAAFGVLRKARHRGNARMGEWDHEEPGMRAAR